MILFDASLTQEDVLAAAHDANEREEFLREMHDDLRAAAHDDDDDLRGDDLPYGDDQADYNADFWDGEFWG